MIEIEAKTKLKSSDGAHFFFTLIFLSGSWLVQLQFAAESCNVNLNLLVDFIFYSQLIKATYLIITLVPRYKNKDILLFFEFLDISYYLFLFGLFVYANVLYLQDDFDACIITAPVHAFFTQLFLIVTYAIFIIILLAGLAYSFRIATKSSAYDQEQFEDS